MTNEKDKMESVALVPAAGRGERLGLGPKAFLELNGKSLLLRAAENISVFVSKVIAGVPEGHLSKARQQISHLAEVYPGGNSRFSTIKKLFDRTTDEKIILIHDVARPFAGPGLIKNVIDTARTHGASVTVSPTGVPVANVKDEFVTSCLSRRASFLGETPQAFHREILDKALNHALHNNLTHLSPWELVLDLGLPLKAVVSDQINIKITTSLDWDFATKIIEPEVNNQ